MKVTEGTFYNTSKCLSNPLCHFGVKVVKKYNDCMKELVCVLLGSRITRVTVEV